MRTHSDPALPVQIPRTHDDLPAATPVPKPALLWVGDAVAATGFAAATHNICAALQAKFEIHVLGLNYHGDPTPYQKHWSLYPASAAGDHLGYARIGGLVKQLKPDVIVIQNDPWNFPPYIQEIRAALGKDDEAPAIIGYVAVDGKNCPGQYLAGVDLSLFWTEFGRREALRGGYFGRTGVVPLGVDLAMFSPGDGAKARERIVAKFLALRGLPPDTFIVGCVGRNQWRKRLDLTVRYFANWIKGAGIEDALLWIHSAPTGDDSWALGGLAEYYGVVERVASAVPKSGMHGFPQEIMADVYRSFDCLLTTTLGEGFHLPTFEAMASGVPVIAPDWSALGEFGRDAARLVRCSSEAVHPRQSCTTVGGIMDEEEAITALDDMYADAGMRGDYAARGLRLVAEPRFRWENVGAAFLAQVEAEMSRA